MQMVLRLLAFNAEAWLAERFNAYLLRPEKLEATSVVGQGFCSAWQRRCGSE